ncbi:hypothetical protein Lal_00029460, partial [Lupinus albus]
MYEALYHWQQDSSMDNLGKQLAKKEPDHAIPRMLTLGEKGEYTPRRRGRPRKPYQGKQFVKSGKLHEETGNIRGTSSTQEANMTFGNEEENANPTNIFSSLQIPNALYDPKFARGGLPVDPFLRLFKEKFVLKIGGVINK